MSSGGAEFNTTKRTPELGAKKIYVQGRLTPVRTVCVTNRTSHLGYSSPAITGNRPSLTDVPFYRGTAPCGIEIVAGNTMVILQCFLRRYITREVYVPLACSAVFAMAMPPDRPFLLRLVLANIVSFFMWHRVMMPLRATFTGTVITRIVQAQMYPLPAVTDQEVCSLYTFCVSTGVNQQCQV